MDPEVQDILTRFKHLKSTSARRALYHLLLEQMHPYEWRDVRDRMNQVSFQKDILGSLPTEVAVKISRHLDLSEIHIFRRVSKRWNFLLSSRLFRDAVCHRYVGHNCRSIALDSPDAFTQYAKQHIRLERGQPISKVLNRPYSPILDATGLVSLEFSHGSYAWIEDAIVYVHNLHSNTMQSFCTDNRDPFTALRISESIVAAITLHGFCHVWSLQTNDSAYFRLPSLQWKYFVVRGMNVAIAYNGAIASGPDCIIHWQLDCRVTRTFNIANKIAYLDVDPTSSTLITVHLEKSVDPDTLMHTHCCPAIYAQLRVNKYPFKDTVAVPSPSCTVALSSFADPAGHVEIDDALSLAFGNAMGILTSERGGRLAETPGDIAAITYNQGTGRVSVNVVSAENTPFIPLCMTSVDSNILYYVKNDNGKPEIWISNPDARIAHRPARWINPQLPREASNRVYSHGTHFMLRGDRDFILMVDQNGLKVWCFNENMNLSSAIPL
ncbi:F-box domain protein [Aspergillus pseudotamarii]|uniref:F-box domain protein n=1 Tax=Aspergillus pseudotamarii TaxID=132259 RepID=A0A5N6SK32_ASPPS|nr:F-box domain protein [Aspergillus pseudotamarii]KAE8133753.1 F-box domain protein [Aspergillus pseudotamarii]